ncbi:MAG: hypothetical protein BIFFINMI_02317 [Phycisphaerae bacterium]|nr:hypothetical protein [Phycisphaerae bacterium]
MARMTSSPTPTFERREASRSHLRSILVAWLFGAAWAALVSGAPMIRFSEEMGLKSHPFAWGLLAAMPYIATVFQFLGSYLAERGLRRKATFFIGLLIQRLTWLAIAALPWLIAPRSTAAILSVLGLVGLQAAGAAFGTPAWTSWMASVIPTRVRGRYFGLRTQLGMMTLIPTALVAGVLLNSVRTGMLRLPWPHGLTHWTWWSHPVHWTTLGLCSAFFAIASILGVLDVLMFWRVPDQRRSPGDGHRPPTLREIFGPPLRNVQFRRFLTYYFTFTIAVPGIGYYVWLYVLNGIGVGDVWAQAMFMGGGGLGAIVACGMWGKLIDRFGRKTVWRIAYVLPIVLPLLYGGLSPRWWALGFAVTILDGAFWNGVEQTNFNNLLHFSGGQNGAGSSSYQAIFALALALAGTLSGLLFGGIARLVENWHADLGGLHLTYFHAIFAAAVVIRLLTYLFLLPRVQDDGVQPVRAAVQYMLSGAYNRVWGMLTFPWRVISAAGARRPGGPDADPPDADPQA